jgi:hypothetical protein
MITVGQCIELLELLLGRIDDNLEFGKKGAEIFVTRQEYIALVFVTKQLSVCSCASASAVIVTEEELNKLSPITLEKQPGN